MDSALFMPNEPNFRPAGWDAGRRKNVRWSWWQVTSRRVTWRPAVGPGPRNGVGGVRRPSPNGSMRREGAGGDGNVAEQSQPRRTDGSCSCATRAGLIYRIWPEMARSRDEMLSSSHDLENQNAAGRPRRQFPGLVAGSAPLAVAGAAGAAAGKRSLGSGLISILARLRSSVSRFFWSSPA